MAGVEITNLTKQYLVAGEEFYALKDVSTVIPDGSFTVIVGRSGCGKTTLLRLLGNLEEKSAGRIRLGDGGSKAGGRRIGMVFQEHRLMPWLSVKENMAFSCTRQEQRDRTERLVAKYLRVLGLEKFQDAYPAQLSGGMAQRVALGRTLCYDPDIILMDEPFGALDYFTRQRLQREIVDLFLAQKKTIVFVTHDVTEAVYLGQKIIVMDAGEVVRELPVDLPYLRDPASPEFLAVQREILSSLRGDQT
ncbi:MAG TPA: ABC transporter ATP-binding protein [Selenomonadales bacterium]|nr:ABC transporter ATP-binding protein [Selenomonadales bacterium]